MIRIAIIAALFGVAGIAASALTISHERGLKETIKGHEACEVSLQGTDLSASAARCPAKVAAVHSEARRAAVCDQALLAGELFVVRTSCSTEVKTLFADRQAETRRADDLNGLLGDERAGRAAAITRAEVRARSETERKFRAAAVISSAPRNGDLLVLDADRLRQLGGEAVAQ